MYLYEIHLSLFLNPCRKFMLKNYVKMRNILVTLLAPASVPRLLSPSIGGPLGQRRVVSSMASVFGLYVDTFITIEIRSHDLLPEKLICPFAPIIHVLYLRYQFMAKLIYNAIRTEHFSQFLCPNLCQYGRQQACPSFSKLGRCVMKF